MFGLDVHQNCSLMAEILEDTFVWLPSLKCNEQQCWRSISINLQLWTSTPLLFNVSNTWYTAIASWKTSINPIFSWFNPLSHVPFPSLWSYQRISPGRRHMYLFRVCASFYGKELLVPCPTSKLKDHTLSAVRDYVFNIFGAAHVIGGPFLHMRSEDAPCHGDRDQLIVGFIPLYCKY